MKNRVVVLGIAAELGAKMSGTGDAPAKLRQAGIIEVLKKYGIDFKDLGDIKFKIRKNERIIKNAKHLGSIITNTKKVLKIVGSSVNEGDFLLVFGGDHSISMGTLGQLAKANKKIGVLYLDAHGDFNTPVISPSGNVHGMGLAILAGEYHLHGLTIGRVNPHLISILGVRDLDPEEKILLKDSEVKLISVKQARKSGLERYVKHFISVCKKGDRKVHVSLDIDVMDPKFAPGTATPVAGGFTKTEMLGIMKLLGESDTVVSLEIVEVNPHLDHEGTTIRTVEELVNVFFYAFSERKNDIR
jgi:arginase